MPRGGGFEVEVGREVLAVVGRAVQGVAGAARRTGVEKLRRLPMASM